MLFVLSPLLLHFVLLPTAPPPIKKSLASQIDAYVKPFDRLGCFSGCVLVAKGDRIIFSKAYGLANREWNIPNTLDTKFMLASVSKTFTAAAIMLLQKDGKLKVEDELTKHLPEFSNFAGVTIAQMMQDRSGIPNINTMPEYEQQVRFHGTPQSVSQLLKGKELLFKPGSKNFSESSGNWVLLACIIEKLSGKTYHEFVHDRIFQPLKLNSTGSYDSSEKVIPKLASGYLPTGYLDLGKAGFIDWSFKTGNGSIYSTVEDLYRWDRALAKNALLDKDTLDTMHKNAYGWFPGKNAGHTVMRYNGRAPGYQTEIHRYIDDDVFVAVTANNYSTVPSLLAPNIGSMYFGEDVQPLQVVPPVKVPVSILKTYAGKYKFGPNFYAPNVEVTLFVSDEGELMSGNRSGTPTGLIAQGENNFIDRNNAARIQFLKNNDGSIKGYRWLYGKETFETTRIGD